MRPVSHDVQRILTTVAARTGRAWADVMEYWNERAGVRQYCGGASRDDAERGAAGDCEGMG